MVIIFAISTNIKPGHCTLKSNTMLYQIYLKKKKINQTSEIKKCCKNATTSKKKC